MSYRAIYIQRAVTPWGHNALLALSYTGSEILLTYLTLGMSLHSVGSDDSIIVSSALQGLE